MIFDTIKHHPKHTEVAMLVLSRKPGERIMIGDRISVTVVTVHGKFVRLGIDAPKEMPVHREEVFLRLRASQTKG